MVVLEQPGGIAQSVRDGFEHVALERKIGLLRHIGKPAARLAPKHPSSRFTWPARTFSKLDFPLPLRPISAGRSPGSSWNSA